MSKTYDQIVVGGGITGTALGYELAKQGFSVLLVEQDAARHNATYYSYGGVGFWAGTTALTKQLCQESKTRYQELSSELEQTFEFRELDLVLTIATTENPDTAISAYQRFATPPHFLSVQEACELEPLLNPNAIAGALTVKHGHINTALLAQAYTQAMVNRGGKVQIAKVTELLRQGNVVQGVVTPEGTYSAANTVICAGGWSRKILQETGISINLCFTHAEVLDTEPVDLKLQSLVMPAMLQRFILEAKAGAPELESLWDEPGHEPVPPILDAGAIQFLDGRIRIGQVSRVLTNPDAQINALGSIAGLRNEISKVLPALEELSTTWHKCLVAFRGSQLPLVGAIANYSGIAVFSGFSNPLALIPPLAQRFARHLSGEADLIVTQLMPQSSNNKR